MIRCNRTLIIRKQTANQSKIKDWCLKQLFLNFTLTFIKRSVKPRAKRSVPKAPERFVLLMPRANLKGKHLFPFRNSTSPECGTTTW